MDDASSHGTSGVDRTGGDLLPVLWICGAPASGKSATAWQLFQRHRDDRVAYVDIDQLKMLFPETGDRFEIGARSLRLLARIHRLLGTRALIVSGVISPDQMPVLEETIADEAAVSWILADADEDTLRRRIDERGWPSDLADRVVAEAAELRESGLSHHIDTADVSVQAAAEIADARMTLRPASGPRPLPELPPAADTVTLVGPRVVGKSTISWGLLMERVGRNQPTGYLDADQLGFLHADEALRDDLLLHALAGISDAFAEAGARQTIINGNLSPHLAAGLASLGSTLIQLDATDTALTDRIAARTGGDAARLAGDDLAGATSAGRDAILETARQQRNAYRHAAATAHRLDVSALDPDRCVTAIRALLPDANSSRQAFYTVTP